MIAQMLNDGIELPTHLQNVPTLQTGLAFYYNAFQDLSSCRANGMSVGPIPWTAIRTYCDEYAIYEDQRDSMFHHIDALDHAYRDYVEKQAAKKSKQLGKK